MIEGPPVILTQLQARGLARLLDAQTIEDMAQARDELRRLLAIPPWQPDEDTPRPTSRASN